LEGKFRVGKTYSSYNTKLTLPITVLNLRGDEEVVVLEMGMGEPGDIAKLVEIAPPDIAVITQVAMAHYGDLFLDGTAGVARAKAEIFGHPKLKKAIFYHHLHADVVTAIRCEKVSYSLQDRSGDYFLAGGVVDERGVRAFRFEIPFSEPHIQHNFLGAVAIARALKMGWDEIEGQVAKLTLPKMRFERSERNEVLFINDAYNANPDSMKAALSCFPEPKVGGKRIAVLGRMVDLGPYSVALHEEVGRFAQDRVDHLITLGNEAKPLYDQFVQTKRPAEHYTDIKSVAKRLKQLVRPGDVVLIKGSRDLAMETLVEGS
jgi:UDP-N-acetylmuramoyl-tripeptide--D-alanyl-D-alanine ligase